MAREIELKLCLAQDQVKRLQRLPLLVEEAEYCGRRALHNQYFDTPDLALTAAGVALRIREQDGRHIQTLKTRGASQGGLHQRNEWEWDLAGNELDKELLKTARWPGRLASDSVLQCIGPVFRTDFERTTWLLRRDGALIEIALDQGEVTAVARDGHKGHELLCEVELELKEGEPAELYAAALELAGAVPLLISDISKAERGYRLLTAEQPAMSGASPVTETMRAGEAFQALAEHALNDVSRGLELWRDNQDWLGATLAAQALQRLRASLACFAPLLSGESESLLSRLGLLNCALDQALSWRTLLAMLDESQVAGWSAQQAPVALRRLDALLRAPEPGLLLLECSRLLNRAADVATAQQPLAFFTPELDKLPL
ncbi:inorganic triphosphatase [Marinobacterium aestuariivivens]|uniref:Inorganic triphosphatase n=1 Tax=Marinobacterium aestuariivivens TaxID=1698799 RepID=A0ABW1ZZ07_9GAMM